MFTQSRLSKIVAGVISITLLAGLFWTISPASPVQARACKTRHTIQAGDSLASLAKQYKVKVEDIVSINKIYSPYTIYVWQLLCIPANSPAPASIPSYANRLAADFSARLRGNALQITTSNFPSSSTYYVKVSPSAPGRQRIGLLKTGTGGIVRPSFTLPDKLVKAETLSVCLKNVVTDANVCRTAKR